MSDRTLSQQEMESIYRQYPNAAALTHALSIARGENTGAPDPALQRPDAELSQLDRFADVREMPIAQALLQGTAVMPAWELYKAKVMGGSPAESLLSAFLSHPSLPPEARALSVTGPGRTSRPSFANVTAPWKGILARFQGR